MRVRLIQVETRSDKEINIDILYLFILLSQSYLESHTAPTQVYLTLHHRNMKNKILIKNYIINNQKIEKNKNKNKKN